MALAWCLAGVALPAAADPRIDYMLHCQGCHLPEGAGWPGRVPPLRGDFGRIAGVAGGRDYLMRVPGVADAPISSAALAGVLNWVMDNYNADTRPKDFVPFSVDEVAVARRNALMFPQARRMEIFATPSP